MVLTQRTITNGLYVWFALSLLVAIGGGLAAVDAADFYWQLNKPTWAPPAWLFSPMWSALYVAMAIAAWRVWKIGGFARSSRELILYIVQMPINCAWTWIFFVGHHGLLAMLDITLLWILILMTLIGFWRRDPLAGLLLVPYFMWVTFAMALTYVVWEMNPTMLGL